MTDLAVFDSGLFLPESPRWHDGCLWVSDIRHRTVWRYDPGGRRTAAAVFEADQSGIGWDAAGRLLAVSMPDCTLLEVTDSGIQVRADLASLSPVLCNDMAVAADGTAYVTQLGFDPWAGGEFRAAPVIRVSPDGSVERFGPDLASPNGIALSADEQTIYVSEPAAGVIRALPADAGPDETGTVVARLAPSASSHLPIATPDGICLDPDGGIWAADPTGHRVVRVADGQVTDQIDLDTQPLAVALGGADGQTLYITTSDDPRLNAPRMRPTGKILSARIGHDSHGKASS
jgi:sugar lactone lactonase YvrE